MRIVKYGLDRVDVGCDDSPMFIGLEMEFCGDTLDECIEEAHIWRVDQDGGDRGGYPLTDCGGKFYDECVERIRRHIAEFKAEEEASV